MPSCFWKSNLNDKSYRFLVIGSGKQVPIEGFDRRSLDAKLSIAVTANFVQNHTPEEAEVRQISGIAKHFHQVSRQSYTFRYLKLNQISSIFKAASSRIL